MLDELKAHLEEMLRGYRSGVAVYEQHIVDALAKLERAAVQLVAPAPVVAQNPVGVAETGQSVSEVAGAGAVLDPSYSGLSQAPAMDLGAIVAATELPTTTAIDAAAAATDGAVAHEPDAAEGPATAQADTAAGADQPAAAA
jgi:hypothetical protein